MNERLTKLIALLTVASNEKRIKEDDIDFIITVVTMLLNEKRDISKYDN